MTNTHNPFQHFIDPAVQRSFIPTETGFRALAEDVVVASPPRHIAAIAIERVARGADVELPNGFYGDSRRYLAPCLQTSGEGLELSVLQAQNLSEVGSQLLSLNLRGDIDPPLTAFEEQSIAHLCHLVHEKTRVQGT